MVDVAIPFNRGFCVAMGVCAHIWYVYAYTYLVRISGYTLYVSLCLSLVLAPQSLLFCMWVVVCVPVY